MSKNKNLNDAKKEKFDEYYTQISDIENELKHYRNFLVNKVVLCNCDDPEWSAFSKHFRKIFDTLKLKKLICTSYNKGGHGRAFIWTKELSGIKDGRLNEDNPFIYDLKGDGDYKSEECLNYLKEADIVCTNPPFSIIREFILKILEYKKDFILIGPGSTTHHKEIFPLIANGTIKVGFTHPSKYLMPDGTYKIFGNHAWFTTFPIQKCTEIFDTGKKYYGHENEYPKYDYIDAINVDAVKDIPMDYYQNFGITPSLIEVYNSNQFEIIDMMNGKFTLDVLNLNKGLKKKNTQSINGKIKYRRVLVRRKLDFKALKREDIMNLNINFLEEQINNKKIDDTFVYEDRYKEIEENFRKSLNKELYLIKDGDVFGDFTVENIINTEDKRSITFSVDLREFGKPNRYLLLQVSESKK